MDQEITLFLFFRCQCREGEWRGFLSISYLYKYIDKAVDVATIDIKSDEKINDKEEN